MLESVIEYTESPHCLFSNDTQITGVALSVFGYHVIQIWQLRVNNSSAIFSRIL